MGVAQGGAARCIVSTVHVAEEALRRRADRSLTLENEMPE